MKHASAATLHSIEPLLEQLRDLPGLKEKKLGVFYRKSKAFLHFHEDDGKIYADVRLNPPAFDRRVCTTRREQAKLVREINKALSH